MLVTRRSNLKDLKFDKDTKGGGSSGQPYLKGGLPENSPAGESLANTVRFSKDYPLRGGASSLIFSTQDTIRVSRFLNGFPEGALFTTKQVGLQRSNPLMETGDRGTRFTLDGSVANINTQRYNLNANLLVQVASQGTGIHIPRAGFNTNDLRDPQNKYEYIVKERNEQGLNRLEALYNTKIQNNLLDSTVSPFIKERLGISDFNENILFDYPGGPGSSYGLGNTIIPRVTDTTISYQNYISNPRGFTKDSYNPTFNVLSKENPYNVSSIAAIWNNSNIDNFIQAEILEDQFGIPNNTQIIPFISESFIGENSTKYQQSSPDFIRPVGDIKNENESFSPFSNTLKYNQLLKSKETSGGKFKLQDFRKFTDASTLASNYGNNDPSGSVRIETRLKLGDPGARTRSNRKYINDVNNGVGQDKINLIPLYSSTGDPIQNNNVRDMIKFCIEVMDNDTLGSTTPLHFRAYITNFSDNIGATWNGQKYMGRGEDFYTYQGFTREVSFNLKVAAQSKQEMMPLYQKLNYLASSLHPDYSNSGFMRGNLHKLTIGEWFYRTPGILKSMNVSIKDDYPWEIKYNEPETSKFDLKDFQKSVQPSNHKNGNIAKGETELFQNSNSDADMMELPQILDISFTFTPILNNLPRLAKQGSNFTTGSILISDHGEQENFIKRIIN
jgi:hypothetical protein